MSAELYIDDESETEDRRYYVDCPNSDCMWEGTEVIGTLCPKCGTPTIAAQREPESPRGEVV